MVEVAEAIEEQQKTNKLLETEIQKRNETAHDDKLSVILEEENETGHKEDEVKKNEPAILIPNTSVSRGR